MGTLPLLLCGPALRRVTSLLVSVWVAVREPGTVLLDVYRGNVDVGSTAGVMAATSAPTVITATAAIMRVAASLRLALLVAEIAAPAAPLQKESRKSVEGWESLRLLPKSPGMEVLLAEKEVPVATQALAERLADVLPQNFS